jgi:hypothetical protein
MMKSLMVNRVLSKDRNKVRISVLQRHRVEGRKGVHLLLPDLLPDQSLLLSTSKAPSRTILAYLGYVISKLST